MKLNISKIRKELDRLGWTNSRFAKELGKYPQAIHQLLMPAYAENHTLKTIKELADVLNVDPKDLIE